ncbi:winged helix-turn-helix domain-containing protein [Novosphingobium sp. G106]|uniref:winged helix-turn-helix domain-containing protein n=1 Tax=Novosphingobium sp. G106 TaxID=2849500 RepID=UPI001C2D5841|nr:winged helix-turn-helix domain-containing protein [Novosphingobium sp. G106]MBV1690611.1 winged helix-turn-helix domain-containing protein [Novosphingobium sp. G106]
MFSTVVLGSSRGDNGDFDDVKAWAVATTQFPQGTTERLDLAHAQDFALGDLIVHPSTREIESAAGNLVLEPRVMQVLVTLHRAQGRVVSREDLQTCCWEGRIVGDDAINRVLSRLRRVADGVGSGSFRIETITKVGYRLIETEPLAIVGDLRETKAAPRQLNRRRALIGLACAGGAAAIGTGLWIARPQRNRASPEVEALMKQAEFAVYQDTQEGQNQALGLYRKAIALQPDCADAWGSLAVTYACAAPFRSSREIASFRARAIEAAKRALALEPSNSFGTVAIAYSSPIRGKWLERERTLRQASARNTNEGILVFALSCLLSSVGRSREAADLFLGLRPDSQKGPGLYFREVMALTAAGQPEAADRLLAEARQTFPTHFALWFADCYIRLYSGRASAAVALIEDVDGRPTGIPPAEFDSVLKVARAVLSHDPTESEAAAKLWIARAHLGAGYAENAIQFTTALGRLDDAFAVAEAYYFSRGFVVPEVRFTVQQGSYTPMSERQTVFLFNPSLARFRIDPRFDRLVQEIGLKDYWDRSGTKPDYRL